MISVDDIRSAVIETIIAAFADVKRGKGVSLHEADVIDDHGSAKERKAARLQDTEVRWQDVPERDIEHYDWVLSFLDAEGLRYYMPAYMVWSLKNYRTADSLSVDAPIYACGFSHPEYREWGLSRFGLFTTEQRRVTCCFLRFMADYGDDWADSVVAQQALDGYWGQFCSGAV